MGRWQSVTRLDSNRLVAKVIHIALLNVIKDHLGSVDEGLVHIFTCLRTRLKEDEIVLFSEGSSLLVCHFSLTIQVLLVAHQYDGHLGVGMLKHLLKPPHQVLECVLPGYIVDQ